MRQFIYFIGTLILTSSYSNFGWAQRTGNAAVAVHLPVVALVDIEPSGTTTFDFTSPTEAGLPLIAPAVNTTKWVNYTSAITLGGPTRRVTAAINQTIPGVDIKLVAASASGSSGAGALGIPNAMVTLSPTAQNIITGIGGAYTGNGANNGHQLTLTLTLNTYSNLVSQTNSPIIITYTITE